MQIVPRVTGCSRSFPLDESQTLGRGSAAQNPTFSTRKLCLTQHPSQSSISLGGGRIVGVKTPPRTAQPTIFTLILSPPPDSGEQGTVVLHTNPLLPLATKHNNLFSLLPKQSFSQDPRRVLQDAEDRHGLLSASLR